MLAGILRYFRCTIGQTTIEIKLKQNTDLRGLVFKEHVGDLVIILRNALTVFWPIP